MMDNMIKVNNTIKDILILERKPVGVKFVKENDLSKLKDRYDSSTKMRYCQALMRAGKGEKIMITSDNIACPASAAAFGLKPLPEMLSSGQMLYNMGLFATLEAGAKAMSGMTRLGQGEYTAVVLSPLETMEVQPDVVVIESKPEHLMWLSLASIYETGERLEFNSAIFQATCVDSTVIPFTSGKLNSTLGCYGCREATDVTDGENLIGIPYGELSSITANLEKLSSKPMKRARAKEAFHSFSGCGES
ncbi:DUF169 domain-containing protein [Fusibacter sp. 3D3]|uniref:DUF169 domain-containing protein n=1 Tax=Fusibacter sp. 3D3 TaxID=1048380 RepID=UPI000856E0DD|nr:DUF169 domain-containing protein [Fusibacter sp. 3D3]GAU79914.1 uncharacterized protein MJ0308 [Fusibacter sp. 3D3]